MTTPGPRLQPVKNDETNDYGADATPPDPGLYSDAAPPGAADGAQGRSDADSSIGAMLVDSGRMTLEQAERAIALQNELGIRFGEAAMRLKFVKEEDIRFALARQHGYSVLRKGDTRVSPQVRAAFDPYCSQVEALRVLRSQLMLRWFSGEPDRRALAVVSPGAREGRSFVTANLAVLFAQLGRRTLVIDADLRHPMMHTLFGLQDKIGLSTLLSHRAERVNIDTVPDLPNLSVLVAGPVPPNPQELLGREHFSRLLAHTTQAFDIVLIDTSGAQHSADAHTVAVKAGGALIVVREQLTRLAEVDALRRSLSGLGTNVVGAVLNKH